MLRIAQCLKPSRAWFYIVPEVIVHVKTQFLFSQFFFLATKSAHILTFTFWFLRFTLLMLLCVNFEFGHWKVFKSRGAWEILLIQSVKLFTFQIVFMTLLLKLTLFQPSRLPRKLYAIWKIPSISSRRKKWSNLARKGVVCRWVWAGSHPDVQPMMMIM